MGAVSLRLPDELEQKLDAEADRSGQPRSQLIRDAIAELIARRERERVLAEVTAAARVLASDPTALAEARQIAEDFVEAENDALDVAEGRRPGQPWREELGERWWK
jgi:metal-responsive CopG/Arc/MetJ family transcriptional regulator